MTAIDIKDLTAPELAGLLHFYRDSGVDWLVEDHPVDRVAEFAAARQAAAAAQRPAVADPAALGQRGGRVAPRPAAEPAAPRGSGEMSRTGPLPVVPDSQVVGLAEEIAARADTVSGLEAAVAAFDGCNLKASARSTAFLDGNRDAHVLIIGPPASAEDDRDGKPFSGPAGDMFDLMLKAIGLSRDSVLAANSVPWRPPGNRAPTPVERDICRVFIRRLMVLARPEAVLLMGNFPARLLIDENDSIHGLRGKWFEIALDGRPVPVLATFHPAEILQAPLNKPLVWRDLLMFRTALASKPDA